MNYKCCHICKKSTKSRKNPFKVQLVNMHNVLASVMMTSTSICVLSLVLLALFPVSYGELYSSSDPVVQLNALNFENTVLNKDNAWLVEFYATWCGHCQRFAPTYRSLARHVQGWGHMIKIAAIACSQTTNVHFCRAMNVRGYPTLRFFPPRLASLNHGVEYRGAPNVRSLTLGIVDYLYTVGGKPSSWPILEPLSSLKDVQQQLVLNGSKVLVIIENQREQLDDYTAKQLLFDLSSIPNIKVVRMRGEHIRSGVYELHQGGSLLVIKESSNRTELREATLRFLRRSSQRRLPTTTVKPTRPTSIRRTSTNGLHMQDLESGLYHSLWLEVGSNLNISDRALDALRNYIHSLALYFPGNQYVMRFIQQLHGWMQTTRYGHIGGEEWVRKLTELQSPESYIPERIHWTGCSGSKKHYRGYPCSLWQIFHTLTVNSLESNINNPQYDSRQVLEVIRDYVHHFLGCRNCAEHFLNMTRDIEWKVRRPRDGVLWLWQAHNKVNKRLAGDPTEDPYHPKTEFPPATLCPTCRMSHPGRQASNSTRWNEEEVLVFLRRFYGKDFVILDNLPYEFKPQNSPIHSSDGFASFEDSHQRHPNNEHVSSLTTTSKLLPTTPKPRYHETPSPTAWASPPLVREEPAPEIRHTPIPYNVETATPLPPTQAPPPLSTRRRWRTRPTVPTTRPTYTPEPRLWTSRRQNPSTAGRPTWTSQSSRDRGTITPRHDDHMMKPCPGIATKWSDCSTSCGPGLSTRMRMQGPECQMEAESRICQLRPCNYKFTQNHRTMCGATYQSYNPLSLVYGECRTTRYMKWRYCGECGDKCCRPTRSHTREMTFVCGARRQGQVIAYASVEVIELCECRDDCT